MEGAESPRSSRLSRELRGRMLLFGATVVASALVSFIVAWNVRPSDARTTLTVSTSSAASAQSATQNTNASVGYDGPAICAPTTDAALSGGSPSTLESSATEVASGTIEGDAWSLWSANGQSGAEALEDGGLVFDGHEYGLCPGYPNPSETEMIDTGGDAVIYGVVNYPGLATVTIGTGEQGFTIEKTLPSPKVAVVNGVSFYIGTLPQSACDYSYLVIDTTSPSASAEHNIGFGENGAGQGYAITNNPGNTGACVTGKLDPLSFSQGEWDMSPGQFDNNS
jgi:hypothetical protein